MHILDAITSLALRSRPPLRILRRLALLLLFGLGSMVWGAPADPGATEVVVTGYGCSRLEAERDALRAAVLRVVGGYLDAETLVRNEEVIQERVLVYSDGIVSRYEILGDPRKPARPQDPWEVTIRAQVLQGKLIQNLRAANIAVVQVSGRNAWSQAVTEMERQEAARRLLKALFENHFGPSLWVVRHADDKGNRNLFTVEPAPEGKAGFSRIRLQVEFYFNLEKYYDEALPRLLRVCDGLGVRKMPGTLVRETPLLDIRQPATGYPLRKRVSMALPALAAEPGQTCLAVAVGRDRYGANQRFILYQGLPPGADGILSDLSNRCRNGLVLRIRFLARDNRVVAEDAVPIAQALGSGGQALAFPLEIRDGRSYAIIPEIATATQLCDEGVYKHERLLADTDLQQVDRVEIKIDWEGAKK